MTTTYAHTDPSDTTYPPGIIAAIPARPILVTEPHVPDMVLKMLQHQLSSVGPSRAGHEAHRQNAASPIEPGSPRRLKSWSILAYGRLRRWQASQRRDRPLQCSQQLLHSGIGTPTPTPTSACQDHLISVPTGGVELPVVCNHRYRACGRSSAREDRMAAI